MATHTPGPWWLDYTTGDFCARIRFKGEHEMEYPLAEVRFVAPPEWTSDEGSGLSNARLMVAAPDLLAALKEAREELFSLGRSSASSYDHGDLTSSRGADRSAAEIHARIDAAIAKAGGR